MLANRRIVSDYKRNVVNEVKKARDTVSNEIKQLEYAVAKSNSSADVVVSGRKSFIANFSFMVHNYLFVEICSY